MNKNECENCKHFIQHYFKMNDDYEELCCGSCIRGGRLILVIHSNDVCKYFEEKTLIPITTN